MPHDGELSFAIDEPPDFAWIPFDCKPVRGLRRVELQRNGYRRPR